MPPKLKKQPHNAYYFYMLKRKEELQKQGYRFPGGMKDVANAVGPEWAGMTAEQKLPFEEMARKAKETGKGDLTNKYTSQGESYAEVQLRIQREELKCREQDEYVAELGKGDGALDRVFILIKTTHCVEQILERNEKAYWPIEISMVAFTLKGGLQSIYWTLVDVETTPVGYASAAKECSEETGLPEPGTPALKDYRDYNKIMRYLHGFIRYWTKQDYSKGPVVFVLDGEEQPARGCLKWIANHVNSEKRKEMENFVNNLKVYKLTKLIINLAAYANNLNPSYMNAMVTYQLEHSAASILSKGSYDYKDEITCEVHKTNEASARMNTCCRNVVMKRMYLMFEEFIPAFRIERQTRHKIEKLKEALVAKAKKAGAMKAAQAQQHADAVAASSSQPPLFRKASWGNSASANNNGYGNDNDEGASHSPSSRLPRDISPEDDDFEAADSPSSPSRFTPWGSRPAREANFSNDDFPTLGSGPMPSMGRGRGRGTVRQDDLENGGYENSTTKNSKRFY